MVGDVSDYTIPLKLPPAFNLQCISTSTFDLCRRKKKTASPLSSSVPFSPLHSSMSPFPKPPAPVDPRVNAQAKLHAYD
ncbi:unnamed protein product [Fusarium fujikuroi]|uniref:Uncharacterized protein n=1 Tax=Fusarium fujikuroi TaxID=5127 RepID=A0A9Q9UCE1_FUSFU|nr:uncharacterized protein FFNC_06125 [Fusarium fujikuroi]VTT59497.1 unnamed protein product [Fusarium fujikuroi]VTT69133.1 unnamed protein product [Fusarium fujikuroi]